MAITYEPIATNTVSGSTTHQVDFTSTSGSYTDLIIVANGYTVTSDISQRIRFNSDSASNYSLNYIGGNGTTVSGLRVTNGSGIYANYLTGWTASSTQPSNWIFQIMSYANTSTYKTCISRANTTTGGTYPGTELLTSLWRSTSAITSISVEAGYSSTHYYAAGTTITLYGIKAA